MTYLPFGLLLLALSCAVVLVLALMFPEPLISASRGTAAADVASSPQAYRLQPGPLEVAQAEFDLTDDKRKKGLPLRVYYPTSGGPYPVIVFSHGAGGGRDVAPQLLAHWVSYGYIVIAPSHADSVALRREQGAADTMGDILKGFATDAEYRFGRARDINFILDSLRDLPAHAPGLAGKLDPERIGVGGHSAGAMTTALVGGAQVNMPLTGEPGPDVSDSRVGALLILSGQGMIGPGGGFHKDSWAGMSLPTMVMTGSFDNSPRTRQTSSSRRHPYEYAPPGDKYLLYIEGALHMSFTGRAANAEPGLDARWLERYLGTPDLEQAFAYDQQAIFDYVIMSSQAFWDAYLKNDAEAKKWLEGDAIVGVSKGQVEYLRK